MTGLDVSSHFWETLLYSWYFFPCSPQRWQVSSPTVSTFIFWGENNKGIKSHLWPLTTPQTVHCGFYPVHNFQEISMKRWVGHLLNAEPSLGSKIRATHSLMRCHLVGVTSFRESGFWLLMHKNTSISCLKSASSLSCWQHISTILAMGI